MNRVVGIIVRYVLTLWVASVAVFALLRVVPGDPAEIALGVTATPELVAEKRAALGIDQPLLTQYGQWVKGMLTGDFGLSMTSGKDISELVLDRLQVSLILVVCAIIVSLAIAIPMGSWAARRHRHADGRYCPGDGVRGQAWVGACQRVGAAECELHRLPVSSVFAGDGVGSCAVCNYDPLRAQRGAQYFE